MKLPGRLRVELPAAGVLKLSGGDGKSVPAVVSAPAGRQSVLIEVPGFLPWSGTVDIIGGDREQRLAPQLVANSAPATIESQPSDAQVIVDGKESGTTPWRQTLAAGSHALELRRV